MSDSTSSSSLGPTGIAFGLGMALVGLVLGYMIGTSQSDGPSESEIAAQVDKAVEAKMAKSGANNVVNNTGGELRKLSDAEKKELLAKKNRKEPAAPAPPPSTTDHTATIAIAVGVPVGLGGLAVAVWYYRSANSVGYSQMQFI